MFVPNLHLWGATTTRRHFPRFGLGARPFGGFVPLDACGIPARDALGVFAHQRLDLVDLARQATRRPLKAVLCDEIVVLDSDTDIGMSLHRARDLFLERAVLRRVGNDVEEILADVDAGFDAERTA